MAGVDKGASTKNQADANSQGWWPMRTKAHMSVHKLGERVGNRDDGLVEIAMLQPWVVREG